MAGKMKRAKIIGRNPRGQKHGACAGSAAGTVTGRERKQQAAIGTQCIGPAIQRRSSPGADVNGIALVRSGPRQTRPFAGDVPEEVMRRIADYRAHDKHDPEYYLRRTVSKAQAEIQITGPDETCLRVRHANKTITDRYLCGHFGEVKVSEECQ